MYYLATPTTKELYTEKNIFQDPIKEKLKNKSPCSDREICGPKSSFKKLSEMKTQSCDQSQIQQTELTRFEKFYQTIRPIVGQMQLKNKADSTRTSMEPKIKKKSNIAQPELYNKNEILYHFKMLNQKNMIRREQKDELLANIKKDKKLVLTRDERVLDKLKNLQQDRNETSVILGNRTGRSFDRTLYQRSNDYRKKLEMQLALDNNLLLDKRIWYRQIRKQSNHNLVDLYSVDEKQHNEENQVIADIYTNFTTHHTPQPRRSEVILLNQNNNANLYQKKTMNNLKKRLSEVVPGSPLISFNHNQQIQIQGVSQYNREISCILQDQDDSMYQIVKNNDGKSSEDEEFINNWNLKKQGQGYYPKICKYVL